jgi:hypothetical protein
VAKSPAELTVTLSPQARSMLDNLAGETPNQKIAHLLLRDIRRKLEACEDERLALELKYGMEYAEFKEHLDQGALGEPFDYELEQDAMRWADLLEEKRHWFQQLRLARDLIA